MIALQRLKLKEITRWLPGIVISLAMIFILFRLIDPGQVVRAMRLLKVSWLLPGVLFYLCGIFLRAWTWAVLLQAKVSFPRVFLTINEGYLLNNLLPFRLGELGRAVLLNQVTRVSTFFVLSTILIERAYDLAIASGLLLATLPYVIGFESARELSIAILLAVGIVLIGLFILGGYRETLKAKLEILWPLSSLFQKQILPRLELILSGLGILRNPVRFLMSLGLILASWFFGLLEIHVLAIGIGIEPAWWWTGFVLGIVSLGIAVPSAPASLGVYEASMVGGFLLLGVPGEQALAVAFTAHLIHILITGVIGGFALARDGQSLSGIYLRLRQGIGR